MKTLKKLLLLSQFLYSREEKKDTLFEFRNFTSLLDNYNHIFDRLLCCKDKVAKSSNTIHCKANISVTWMRFQKFHHFIISEISLVSDALKDVLRTLLISKIIFFAKLINNFQLLTILIESYTELFSKILKMPLEFIIVQATSNWSHKLWYQLADLSKES